VVPIRPRPRRPRQGPPGTIRWSLARQPRRSGGVVARQTPRESSAAVRLARDSCRSAGPTVRLSRWAVAPARWTG